LCRLKGNGGFGGALRTNCPGFCAYTAAGSGYTLNFALLAPLWIVLELLIVKEQLLTSGKDKVITAIRTLQYLVDEVHTRPPEHALEFFSIPSTKRRIGIVSPTSCFVLQFDNFPRIPNPGMRGEMVPNLFTNS
jgi:hypothetical protein